MVTRREWLAGAAALALARVAGAQSPPRMIVGFPAGGVVDVTARLTAQHLGGFAEPILVDNRAGAGGRIAVEAVKAATPDGRTLLYSPESMFTLYPATDRELRYTLADFAPVSTVCSYPFALAVPPGHPARSIPEFVAWAKAEPGKAAFGSPGVGTIQSFIGATLARASGVAIAHVPYKGGAQSIADVMSGTLPSSISVAQLFVANHKAGKLRVIGTTGQKRLPSLGDVPTFAEQGYPDLTFEESFAVFLPAKTAPETVRALADAVARAVASPPVAEGLAKLDYAPFVLAGDAFAAALRAEQARWARIVQETGFKPT